MGNFKLKDPYELFLASLEAASKGEKCKTCKTKQLFDRNNWREATLQILRDPITGLWKNDFRVQLTEHLIHHVKSGGSGVYVELDIRNVNGSNTMFGNTVTNLLLFRVVAELFVRNLGGNSSHLFRHGGDEFSGLVWGQQGAAVQSKMLSLDRQVRKAYDGTFGRLLEFIRTEEVLTEEQLEQLSRIGGSQISEDFDLRTIVNKHDPSQTGFCISWKTTSVKKRDTASDIFNRADYRIKT